MIAMSSGNDAPSEIMLPTQSLGEIKHTVSARYCLIDRYAVRGIRSSLAHIEVALVDGELIRSKLECDVEL